MINFIFFNFIHLLNIEIDDLNAIYL